MKLKSIFYKFLTILNFIFCFQISHALESKIYLKSSDFDIIEEQKLADIFKDPKNVSTDLVKSLIQGYSQNKNAENYYAAYSELFYSYFEIEDMLDWRMKNSKNLRGAYDYVTDPPDGSDPLWQTTNRKLRNGLKLSSKEAKFVANLNISLAFLPKFEGIVFRGASLTKELISKYQKGNQIIDPTFVSTSINPEIAEKFSKSEDPHRIAVIFVIQVKEGTPVSVLHEFHWEEKEILLKNDQKFEVIQTTVSSDSAYIFLKQL